MAKLQIQAGSTSQTVNVFIRDSSSTTGAGLTGLVFNTSSLTAYYALPKAAAVAITLATLAAVTSAYSSGGFKEIDATNMPGWYRFDVPDAAIASGRFVAIHLKGAANMAPLPLEIELTAWNNQDSVRGGMTALPNAAASAVGGLPVAVDTSGRVDVLKINGTSQTARDIGASVLLSAGTGTGQLDFTSGVVKSNLVQILATALTETAGLLAGGFKKFFNVASPTLTCLGVDQTGDSYTRIGAAGASLTALGDTRIANLDTTVSSRLAPAGTLAVCTLVTTATNLTNAPTAGDFTATMKTSLNAATPASVVGAVGSVTGNVGGNVTGSVGSLATQAKTDVENATWNTVLASHLTGGSTGAALNAAGAAGDPWSTAIPGAYTAGSAGYIVGNRVDAAISSRTKPADTQAAVTLVTTTTNLTNAPTAGDLTATMKASVTAAVPTANQNADALLDRADAIETGWTLRKAIRIVLSALGGKLSGAATTTVTVRDATDAKARITATVDADGNRTAVTLDGA